MEVDGPSASPKNPNHNVVIERLPSPPALAHLRAKLNRECVFHFSDTAQSCIPLFDATVTDDEIFEAKVLVLDILGWGVPPVYLLECGISELAVVVCLSELKLRIPQVLEHLLDQAEREVRRAAEANSVQESSQNRPPTPLSATAAPFHPASSQQPVASTSQQHPVTKPVDLNDIEQQRRQELLARRAVLQSMQRAKGSSTQPDADHGVPGSSASTVGALPTPPIQDGEVDAFLADLIPDGDAVMENGQQHEQMEVEQALVGQSEDESRSRTRSPPSHHDTPSAQPDYPSGLPRFSSDTTNGWTDYSTPGAAPSSHTYPSRFQSNANQRRNAKRPVAADFVEYASQDTSAASTSRAAPTRSYTTDSSNSAKRRRHFGPSTQHRLVIDLSDDEAESANGDEHDPQTQTSSTVAPPSVPREGSAPVDDEKLKLLQQKQREIELMHERIRRLEERKRTTPATPAPVPAHVTRLASPATTSTSEPMGLGSDESVVKTEEPEDTLGIPGLTHGAGTHLVFIDSTNTLW